MDYISRLFGPPPERNITAIVTASVVSTALIFKLAEIAALPYPPDALPGGRDVDSPVS